MTGSYDRGLQIEGTLEFSVDGPGGATAGTVRGDGGTVHVHAGDPVAAWDAALGPVSTGPQLLRSVAGFLHAQGVVLQVSGPAGRVATVGAGVDSLTGRLLTGSRRVRPGRPAAVRPLALAEARRRVAGRGRPAAVAAGLVLVWVVRRRARR